MLTAIFDIVRHTLGEDHVEMTMTLSNAAYSDQGRYGDVELILKDLHRTFLRKIEAGGMDRMHPDFLAWLYGKAHK